MSFTQARVSEQEKKNNTDNEVQTVFILVPLPLSKQFMHGLRWGMTSGWPHKLMHFRASSPLTCTTAMVSWMGQC